MTIRMTVPQRRARLVTRHLLARDVDNPRDSDTPADVAAALVAVHATDPATVHLSVAARTDWAATAVLEHALYEDRSVLRMLGMRRTVFVVPTPLAPIVQAACADDVASKQRALLVRHLGRQGYPDNVAEPEAWLDDVAESAFRALAERGSATAREMLADEPRLGQQVVMAPGKPYESTGNVTSRVLFLLAAQGRIVRGRPRGSWLSTQYHWATTRQWVSGGLPRLDPHTARVELARHWLRAYGPAPVGDLRWWTGWTATQTRKVLAEIAPAEVDLDGVQAIALPDDLDPVATPARSVALLPALDATPMGWFQRDWFVGPHAAALFDRSGNIGPTVWCDGRITGGWAQRPDGEVVVRMLEDVGSELLAAVEMQKQRLQQWLGEVRATPRFRTPLERELAT